MAIRLRGLSGLESLEKILHGYIVKIGYYLELVLPFVLVGVMGYYSFSITNGALIIMLSLYAIFILNSLIILLEPTIACAGFGLGLKYLKEKGYPVISIRGINEIERNLKRVRLLSIWIFLSVISSFLAFLVSVKYQIIPLVYIALGLVFMGFGLTILFKQPKEAVLEVAGGIMEYYTPIECPIYIDNMFRDTIQTLLDPLTLLKFDDWLYDLKESIKIREDIDEKTALERAVEKIFLMAMLRSEFPKLIDDKVFDSEISELVKEDRLKFILDHKYFGKKKLLRIMRRLEKNMSEVHRIICSLFLTLRDNLRYFKDSDLFIDIAVESDVLGIRNVRPLIFLFNNSDEYKDKPRPVRVIVMAPDFEPNRFVVDVKLDPKGEFKIVSDELPIYSKEGEDVVGTLSKILQVGDAVWVNLVPKKYGMKTISIIVMEKDRVVYAKTFNVNVRKNWWSLFRGVSGGGSLGVGAIVQVLYVLKYFLLG